jgi:anti-repressor protein
MNDLMKVDYNSETPTVLGRELHAALEVDSNYTTWMNRMVEYGFSSGTDFIPITEESTGGRPATDHQLTIEMAKEICMIQRTDKGKQCRQYFIELEKKWNSPELVMARALQMANKSIEALKTSQAALEAKNAALEPKGEYYDKLVERDAVTSLRDTAKLLEIPEKKFIGTMLAKNFLYRNQKGVLTPRAEKNRGYFKVKEYTSPTSKATGIQTLVTVKGREHFAKLFAS